MRKIKTLTPYQRASSNALLVLSCALFFSCASAPSIVSEEDQEQTLVESKNLSDLSKSPKQIADGQVVDPPPSENQSVSPTPSPAKAESEFSPTAENTAKDFTITDNPSVLETPLTPQSTISILEGEQYTNSELQKLCLEKHVRFFSYDLLTRLSLQCAWSLPQVLRLNAIQSKADFIPDQEIVLPNQLFVAENSDRTSNKFASSFHCTKTYFTYQNSKELDVITAKCLWGKDQLILLNNLTPDEAQNPTGKAFILPPALEILKREHASSAQKHPVKISFSKETAPPTPPWCRSKEYRVNEDITIDRLASICSFNATAMAKLNNVSTRASLLNQLVILPKAANKTVPKRQYKIPLNESVCQNKFYHVEYGISMGKIATTCQWDYRFLLQLNGLEKNSIIQIGKLLTLPNALYEDVMTVEPSLASLEQEEVYFTDYSQVCHQKSYQPMPEDRFEYLAKECQWDDKRLAIINGLNWQVLPTQLPSPILLPNAVDQIIEQLQARTPPKTASQKEENALNVYLCSQKEILLPPKATLKMVADRCSWNLSYIKLLNGMQPNNQPDIKKPIVLPPSLYEDYGSLNKWLWPVETYYRYRLEGDQHNVLIETPSGSSVLNIQKGLVLYVNQSKMMGGEAYQILIRHSKGYVSLYDNLQSVSVAPGQIVGYGETIGTLSTTSDPEVLRYQLFNGGETVSFLDLLDNSL